MQPTPLQDAMAQMEAAEKWKLAERMMPVLRQTFIQVVPGVEFDPKAFDRVMDVVENYLPKTVSSSDLPEQAQVEILGMLSLVLRQKSVMLHPRRRRQLIGITVGILEFGVKALSYLGVTVRGVPVRQWLARTGGPMPEVITVSTSGSGTATATVTTSSP